VVYALNATQIYKAEALLLPPSAKDIQSLNVQGVQGVTAEGAFAAFKNNLSSRSLQKKFIDEQGLMDILAPGRTPETRDIEILESFAKMIKIEHVKRALENEKGMSVSMESNDPEFAANLVNDYISFFDTETILVLSAAARNSLSGQIRDIEYTIASKRQMAKQRREDTILRHEEAAVIAGKLGVRDRVDTTNVVQNNQRNISTSSTPLYYRGYRALNAEIKILKNRKSDDPFISGLRDLQEILALLSSIKIEAEGMHAVTVDQAAYPPKNRIKPDRRLIVSLSTVVGLFLGIFLVFFVSFVKKQKETHSE
jgi:chain length determinant protein (polysaccharide antigen chain regulator)